MEAIVLAAGRGTRMRPFTDTRPKVMLPLMGRPMLEHVLQSAASAGVTRARLVVHWKQELVRAHLGDGSALGLEITYHEQGEARGTGHAVRAAGTAPEEPFLILSGDTLVDASDLRRLIRHVSDTGRSAMGAVRVDDATAFGALEVDAHDALVRVHEKSPNPPSDLINAGTYAVHPALWRHLEALRPSPRGELELTDALNAMANPEGEGIDVVPLESWQDVGRPWDLLGTNERMMRAAAEDPKRPFWSIDGHVEEGAHIVGPVRVEAGAHVKAGSYIEGPVVIGRDAVIGPCAYLRGYTVVGARGKVGAHTEVKNSLLFDDAKVPHLNYVGDSILGADVNLGAGTKVANLRHDKGDVRAYAAPGERVETGRRKFGVLLGDGVKTGINCSLNVGLVAGPGALFMPGGAYHGHYEGGKVHRPRG